MSKNDFVSFKEAKKYAESLKIVRDDFKTAWVGHCRSGKKPKNIPTNPQYAYSEFTNWGEFLGINKIKIYTHDELKKLMIQSDVNTALDYKKYKVRTRDIRIPSEPSKIYQQWTSWGDFLDTGRVSRRNKGNLVSFETAKELMRKLKIKTGSDYYKRRFNLFKKFRLPIDPRSAYNKNWQGWSDFLGKISNIKDREVVSFKEARKIVKKLNIKNQVEFHTLRKCNHPELMKIPSNPNLVY